VSLLIPDHSLFIHFYIRKEAVLSSQIEGTRSSLSDLLLFESDEQPTVPLDDVEEVTNYVRAMNHGLRRIRSDEFPLSIRLIREIHEILLSGGRGRDKTPGEFRRSQNWLGGSRPGNASYVPPPPHLVPELMSDLEKFMHRQDIPTLIKAALIHVQFESIHPFLDGNGRLGRLLVTFLLCAEGVLQDPLLYLSLYFKMNRSVYYEHLQRVRLNGEWREWILFFLEGIRHTSQQGFETARTLVEVTERHRKSIGTAGRRAGSMLQIYEIMRTHPVISSRELNRLASLSAPAVGAAVRELIQLDLVKEITGKKRDRIFVYDSYLRILGEGPGVGAK
jgi:Fic family protein